MNTTSFYRIIILALFATLIAWHILTVAENSYIEIIPDYNLEHLEEINVEKHEIVDDIQPQEVNQERKFEGDNFYLIEEIERSKKPESELNEVVSEEVVSEEVVPEEIVHKEVILEQKIAKEEVVLQVNEEKQEELVLNEKLSKEGVIFQTNEERLKENKNILTKSEKLTIAAQIKLNDLFTYQYFAHSNESGQMGAEDLAKIVGYEYILIGENLALGNFEDDRDLVEAWMNSPGHRSNILRDGYTEIGVALKEGYFEDEKVWIAVQIFGTPLSNCSKPDKELEDEIEEKSNFLETTQNEITYLNEQLIQEGLTREQYNELAERYNILIERYNNNVLEVELLVDLFNEQIDIFNKCVQELN